METEVRGDGESPGEKDKKEIGLSCGWGCASSGQGFNIAPEEKKSLEGHASSKKGGRVEKETGYQGEEKTKSLAGTPRPARGRYESAMGG